MSVDKQDIQEVAKVLGATVEKMQAANDKRLDGIEGEKAKLAGTVSDLTNNVLELQKHKDELESRLKEMENSAARPGRSADKDAEAHKEAFGLFMRKGTDDGLAALQAKALNLGADEDGAYAVPEDLDTNISSMLRNETPMRQACRVITVGGEGYKKLFNLNGATSGWVGETDARLETGTPTLAQLTPTFGEIYANPSATQKSLDDMFFDSEAWLGEEVQLEFAEQENAAYTSGVGANMPPGLFAAPTAATADATRAFGTFEHVVAGTGGTLTDASADALKIFPHKLKAGYRQNAAWMMAGATLETIMVMKDGQGNYLWRAGLEEDAPLKLSGRRVIENEDMPGVAAGANAIAFGDFNRAYYIFDRMGTRVLRDPYTNKPYVQFYTTKRVGGMVADTRSLKMIQIAP
ncbi:MAG: phage major capsid protein [Agarilytica sp.]